MPVTQGVVFANYCWSTPSRAVLHEYHDCQHWQVVRQSICAYYNQRNWTMSSILHLVNYPHACLLCVHTDVKETCEKETAGVSLCVLPKQPVNYKTSPPSSSSSSQSPLPTRTPPLITIKNPPTIVYNKHKWNFKTVSYFFQCFFRCCCGWFFF